MTTVRKLTPALLRKIVLEEKAKMMRESKSKDPIEAGLESADKVSPAEVDAEDLASTLAKEIDYMKALKIHEKRLTDKLQQIQEAKRTILARVTKNFK